MLSVGQIIWILIFVKFELAVPLAPNKREYIIIIK